ncbi:MAG: YceI family protein [Proteobacteria bacterium]|nr:YceI family protein [Pseudomonadota bacterium]MBU1708550.1 YceI family protein [Pseudomonadota bacterium]
MNRVITSIAVSFVFAFLVGGANAAQEWKIDKDHSALRFSVKHIVTPVVGGFDEFTGMIRFDPNDLENSSIDITVNVSSINTGIKQRDDHLRSADFFEAEKYPEMRFVSKKITDLKNNRYEANGKMTIKQVTKNLALIFTATGEADHPSPKMECTVVGGLVGQTSLKRLDYQVGNGQFFQMGIVGDEVSIELFVEMLRPKADCK